MSIDGVFPEKRLPAETCTIGHDIKRNGGVLGVFGFVVYEEGDQSHAEDKWDEYLGRSPGEANTTPSKADDRKSSSNDDNEVTAALVY